ncbi:MAG: hypothetical protein PVI57_14470 [Gemmatimonadota bacterium]|jgi:hypothetical protein
MTAGTDRLRRLLASILVTILVTLSVAVPAMDGRDYGSGPVFESEHDASACVVGHDHTICTQAGAGRALPTLGYQPHAPRLAVWTVRRAPVRAVRHRLPLPGPRSRAPPLSEA